MDSSYRDRINARRFLLQQNINRAVGLNDRDDRVAEAVTELYTFLMGSYLPRRFPSMFKCHQVEFETGQQYMLQNLPMGDMTPARGLVPPEGTTPIRSLLVNLGRHLDEDFVFLLPGRYEKPGRAKYILEAYVTCCLYGFDPSQRLGKVMQDLRRPATSYDDGNKLESSMDRLLNRLENGKYLQRNIWSVAMKSDLFQPDTRKDSAKKPEFSGDLKPDEVIPVPASLSLYNTTFPLSRPRIPISLIAFELFQSISAFILMGSCSTFFLGLRPSRFSCH